MTPWTDPRTPVRLGALFVLTHVLFATWPEIDLWAAGLFYVGGDFPMEGWDAAMTLRGELVWAYKILLVGALGMLIVGLERGRAGLVPLPVWGFVLLLYSLGPGLLVSGVLKAHVGRARPAHLTEFGGDKVFTPPFEVTDQCAANCSFVSGEGSGAVCFAISLGVIAAYLGARAERRLVVWLGLAVAVVGCAMRVMKGRHFLSDTLFAALFMLALAVVLGRWLLVDVEAKEAAMIRRYRTWRAAALAPFGGLAAVGERRADRALRGRPRPPR